MNFLKKLGVITAFVGSLVATQAVSQSALDEILSDGVLKVGTTGDWNPMSVRDTATNSYVGYDIDIMTELAKDLGVELELVPTDWKTLVNGVVAGKYHMTGSASISPARLKAAGYSDSYISVEILPFTTEDKIGQFDSWESVDKSSVKVSTTLGTTFEKLVREWFPNATINVVEAPARGLPTGRFQMPALRRSPKQTCPAAPQRSTIPLCSRLPESNLRYTSGT